MTRLHEVAHLRPVPDEGVGEGAVSLDSEATLVARARAGDGQAWARLYEDHFHGLYADLTYLVGNPAAAEELSQETFAAALVCLDRFRAQRASFSTWLRGIGHNLTRKYWRSSARRGRAYDRFGSADIDDTRADPEQKHLSDRRAAVLESILEGLPASYREVFILRDVQGLPSDEVAARLAISPGNVRVRANRARAKIRIELCRLGWLESAS